MKWRLAALLSAVGVMGAMIVMVTLNSQRQGTELRAKLDQVDAESFGMAEHFKDLLRDSNDKLTRYRNTRDPLALQEYQKASRELDSWIGGEVAMPLTAREKEVLARMRASYTQYALISRRFVEKIQSMTPGQILTVDASDEINLARRKLFDISQELSQAHLELKRELLAQAHHTLGQLRFSIIGALVLLLLFGSGLAALVYRDMIAPLRSQLVETRAMVEQNEKLASLGLLAAGLAHEIRNPLTAVKAALFTQQKKFAPGSPEHGDVRVVEREIVRLEKIVNDFLKFARPAEPEPEVIAADSILMETKLLYTPQLSANNIRIDVEASAPMHLKADPSQIKQVLINLVQNAADSIGRDGSITLRAREGRKPLPSGEKNTVILEVRDTGRGITSEVQKRLFDPFFTTKDNGTGLGLSIAARMVQKNGGVLQFQTHPGQGSTFGMVLPQATP